MLVTYNDKLYSLDMKFREFQALRDGLPKMEVEIWGVTADNFSTEPIKVKIGDLND